MKKNERGAIKKSLVVLLVLVLIAIIIGAVLYLKNNRQKSKTNVDIGAANSQEGTSSTQTETNSEQNVEQTTNNNEQAEGTGENNLVEEKVQLVDVNNKENVDVVDGEKINNAESITKDKEVNGFKFTNIKLQTESGVSTFTATVTNGSGKDFNGGAIKLTFKDSSRNEIANFEGWIPEIKNDESPSIDAGTTTDVVNAADMTIEML